MPYVDASALTVILPAAVTITATSAPLNLGDVATICAEVSAELDAAAAAAGYSVPVATTSETALAQMTRYAKIGAGAAVLEILAPNVPGSGGRGTIAQEYASRFEKILERLRTGKTVLVGAAPDETGSARELPRSFETSNPGDARGGASPILGVYETF